MEDNWDPDILFRDLNSPSSTDRSTNSSFSLDLDLGIKVEDPFLGGFPSLNKKSALRSNFADFAPLTPSFLNTPKATSMFEKPVDTWKLSEPSVFRSSNISSPLPPLTELQLVYPITSPSSTSPSSTSPSSTSPLSNSSSQGSLSNHSSPSLSFMPTIKIEHTDESFHQQRIALARKRKAPAPAPAPAPSVAPPVVDTKQNKRERNKISASKYRKRRKMYFDGLEDKVNALNTSLEEKKKLMEQQKRIIDALHQNNQELQEENRGLKEQVRKLKQFYSQMQGLNSPNASDSSDSSCPSSPSSDTPKVFRRGLMFAMFACFLFNAPFLFKTEDENPYAVTGRPGRTLLSFEAPTSSSSYASELGDKFWDHDLFKSWSQASPSPWSQKQNKKRQRMPAEDIDMAVKDVDVTAEKDIVMQVDSEDDAVVEVEMESEDELVMEMDSSVDEVLVEVHHENDVVVEVDIDLVEESAETEIERIHTSLPDVVMEPVDAKVKLEPVVTKPILDADVAEVKMNTQPTKPVDELADLLRMSEEAYQNLGLSSYVDHLDNSTGSTPLTWSSGVDEPFMGIPSQAQATDWSKFEATSTSLDPLQQVSSDLSGLSSGSPRASEWLERLQKSLSHHLS